VHSEFSNARTLLESGSRPRREKFPFKKGIVLGVSLIHSRQSEVVVSPSGGQNTSGGRHAHLTFKTRAERGPQGSSVEEKKGAGENPGKLRPTGGRLGGTGLHGPTAKKKGMERQEGRKVSGTGQERRPSLRNVEGPRHFSKELKIGRDKKRRRRRT